jgi:hypothetical protein
MIRALLSSLAGAVLLVTACSSSSDPTGIGVAPPDASETSAPGLDGGLDGTDPGSDAAPPGCSGACKTTVLVVDMGGKTRTLARAQFGTQQGDAGAQLHVEAHLGGEPACPTSTSPTPTYTLIVSSIPRGAAGGKASKSDGVTSAFFDFKGDLGIPPLTRATAVEVVMLLEDTATPPAWSAFDVTATFPEGTVKGHVYAEYCASLTE